MTDTAKRVMSGLLFGAGLVFSLFGCVASAAATFSIGANDSAPEIIAIVLSLPGFFLACVLAFWFRQIAGGMMMILSVIFFVGMLWQAHYSHESLSGGLLPLLRICLPVFFLGVFGLVTGRAGWPEVIRRGQEASVG